jgi:ATP-binding cassette subfamily C protein CydD
MILTYAAEARITRHLAGASQDAARRTMSVLGIAFASSAILEFFAALSVALVAVYCGFSLLGLLPFPAPALTLPAPSMRWRWRLNSIWPCAALPPPITTSSRARPPLPPWRGSWRASRRNLRHSGASPLAGAQCDAGPCRWRAIGPLNWDWQAPGLHVVTGPTGAGKSSLLLALIGQGPPARARSRPMAPLPPGSLNACIGWAGQQVALLSASLRANLLPMQDGPCRMTPSCSIA